jgi:MFS family permease
MDTQPRTAVRRLALARLISITGGAAAYMALMFEIYRRTGSAGWLALTLLLTFGVGGFAGPVAGALGDRFDRRRVMIVSDLLGAVCFAGMAFAHAPWVLLVVAFASALAEAPFFAASAAAIPNLVADDALLGWANGLLGVGENSGVLFGPIVGGLLVAGPGPQMVFAANAISFVVSAAITATVRAPFAAPRSGEPADRRIRAGLSFVRQDRVVRTIALAWVAVMVGGSLGMVADAPMARLFGTGAMGYGLIIACWGGGSVLGSLAGRRMNGSNEAPIILAGCVLMAAGTAVMGLTPWFAPVLAGVAVAGFGDAAAAVASESLIQRRTPDALRSRVIAAVDASVQLAMATSFAVAGPVVAAVGPQGAYLAAAGTAVVAVLAVAGIRRTRQPGRLPEP